MNIQKNIDRKYLIASIFGSIIEWYDFALMGALMPLLSKVFFPEDTPIISLLKICSVFATGFIARPIGAIIIGSIGDKVSRKRALLIALTITSASTFMMGMIPSYKYIGVFSTFLIVILRLIQGFGAGGEHAGGILLLYESSNVKNRIYRTSLSVLGIMIGLFIGFAVAALFSIFFNEKILLEWAWRLPFLFAGVLGLFGLYVRILVIEDKIEHKNNKYKKPIRILLSSNKTNLLLAIGIYAHSVVIFYASYFYLPSYFSIIFPELLEEIMIVRWGCMLLFIFCYFLISKISDFLGAFNMLFFGSLLALIFSWPTMMLISKGDIISYSIGQVVFTLFNVMYLIPIAALFSEMFPRNVRYSGVSIVINIGSAIFGGFAPFIMSLITELTGKNIYSSLYMIIASSISLCCLIILKQRSDEGIGRLSEKVEKCKKFIPKPFIIP